MTASPTVTVVLPVFNSAHSIRAAIDSMLRQTCADFELLVVDDGSTDDTAAVVGAVADPRVRLLTIAHSGFTGALAVGIREARTAWIARMDADDECHSDRLRRQLAFLAEHPECLFVASTYAIVTPNGKYLAPARRFEWEYVETHDLTSGAELFCDPSVMFHRQSAIEAGLFDADFENEKPLWYKLLARGRGAVLGDPLYWYHWHLGTVSRPADAKAEKVRHVNHDVRRRYDPQHTPAAVTWTKGQGSMRHVARAVNYYLLAGDYEAARRAALTAWKTQPRSGQAAKLVLMALLRRRSLRRLWTPDPADRWFRPTEPPLPLQHPS